MVKRTKSYYQVNFLPWAGITDEIKIGPIKLWHFSKAEEKIQKQTILNYLKNYFKSYVDYQHNPVNSIVICSYNGINFKPLSRRQYADLKNAVNALIFCIVAPAVYNAVRANNYSMGPASADRYELIFQNFNARTNTIVVQVGSSRHIWEIGQVKFSQPWALGGIQQSPDNELLLGFDKLFHSSIGIDIKERIFRSLEWFRLAHIENEAVSLLSKVVMMATAFEILLQAPNIPNKKAWIAQKLESQIHSKLIKIKRQYNNGRRYSKLGGWVWDFYDLRNKIVHGDHIDWKLLGYKILDKKKRWITHHIVADLVFLECVKRELFNLGLIGDKARECAKNFDDAFKNSSRSCLYEIAEWFLGFRDTYRALGWIRNKRKLPNALKGKRK